MGYITLYEMGVGTIANGFCQVCRGGRRSNGKRKQAQ